MNHNHSAATTSKWHCSACTYLNHANAVSCEVCGTAKRDPTDQSANNKWICAKCTLINSKYNLQCAVCGDANPSLPFAAEVAEIRAFIMPDANRNGKGRKRYTHTHTQNSRESDDTHYTHYTEIIAVIHQQ